MYTNFIIIILKQMHRKLFRARGVASDVIIIIRTQLYEKVSFLWSDNKNPKLRMINTLPVICVLHACVCMYVCSKPTLSLKIICCRCIVICSYKCIGTYQSKYIAISSVISNIC